MKSAKQVYLSNLLTAVAVLVLGFYSHQSKATTWSAAYPYTQKTENGKVKLHSLPYEPFGGPNLHGETFIYQGKSVAYSIPRYFWNPVFTFQGGDYLVEVDPVFQFVRPPSTSKKPLPDWDEEAIKIYYKGELQQTLNYSQFKVDSAALTYFGPYNSFRWVYHNAEEGSVPLKNKMAEQPIYQSGNSLFLITCDNQLIEIDVLAGKVKSRQPALKALQALPEWNPPRVKRKYRKTDYPEKFQLPRLENGQTLEEALAAHLKKQLIDEEKKDELHLMFSPTILIDKKGKCRVTHIYLATRTGEKILENQGSDAEFKQTVTTWIEAQTFSSKSIPKGFPKFEYRDFIFMQ